DDHRARPGRVAVAGRGRGATAAGAGRHSATRPCDRGAAVRGGSGGRLPPRFRQAGTAAAAGGVAARAGGLGRGRGRHGHHLLRPDDRQADRARRRSRAGTGAPARGAGAVRSRGAEVEHRLPRAAGAASRGGRGTHRHRLPRPPPGRVPARSRRADRARAAGRGGDRADAAAGTGSRAPRRGPASGDPGSPWALADGWRLGHAGKRLLGFLHRGRRLDLVAHGHGGHYSIQPMTPEEGAIVEVDGAMLHDDVLSAGFDGAAASYRVLHAPGSLVLHDGERRLPLVPVEVYRRDSDTSSVQDDKLRAPMPGRVVVVRAARGDNVVAGQELLVIEAMKMELALKAPRDGKVAAVTASAGEFVEADTVLLELEA